MSVAEDPILSWKFEWTYEGKQQSSQAGVHDVKILMKEKHIWLIIIDHFWHNWKEYIIYI